MQQPEHSSVNHNKHTYITILINITSNNNISSLHTY